MELTERPRRLWFSPPCTKLGQIQRLSCHRRGEAWCPALKRVKTVWSRCLVSANLQVNLGGCAHATSSLRSQSWQPCSQGLDNVPSHSLSIDCDGRMTSRDDKGKPIPNSFRIQPTDPDVVNFDRGLRYIVSEVTSVARSASYSRQMSSVFTSRILKRPLNPANSAWDTVFPDSSHTQCHFAGLVPLHPSCGADGNFECQFARSVNYS